MSKQIKNPYIRFGRTAQGPYANKLGGGFFARAITRGEAKCFEVVSVVVGYPTSEWYTVCFNAPPNQATCLTTDFSFTNVTRGLTPSLSNAANPGGNCLRYQASLPVEQNSNAPTDELVMDYVPGTCNKDGTSEPECLLEAYADYPVQNQIYGPAVLRIGDIAANVLVAIFPVDVAQIGSTAFAWRIKFDLVDQTINSAQIISGNEIHFTLAADADPTDSVTIEHNATSGVNACQAVDGRYCWRFYNQPVVNVTGAEFWIREDGDQWRTESVGRWQLE